jgi:Mrp family chromosome partitioning ATPase
MRHRIITDSMVHEFRLLRNRIESETRAPALLFVTSATDADGAGLTAYGLAESLSRTRQRAVLVTTDMTVVAPEAEAMPQTAMRRRASDRPETLAHPTREGRFSVVTISPERLATISRAGVSSLVQGLSSENDYVIVDAGGLPKNSFALLLVSLADAVLIAFRTGRSQQSADRVMLDTLERSESKILGVVMTDEAAIDQFAHHEDHSIEASAPVPERKPAAGIVDRLDVALRRFGKSI